MGMNLTVSLGFYFRVNPVEVETEKSFTICSNKECSEYGKNSDKKFCSQCGSKIEKITKKETKESSRPYDILPSKFEDSVFQAEGSEKGIWLLNIAYPEFKIFDRNFDKYQECENYQIPFDKIAEKLESLQTEDSKLKEIIDYMKEKHGEDSIQLEYGINTYYC